MNIWLKLYMIIHKKQKCGKLAKVKKKIQLVKILITLINQKKIF